NPAYRPAPHLIQQPPPPAGAVLVGPAVAVGRARPVVCPCDGRPGTVAMERRACRPGAVGRQAAAPRKLPGGPTGAYVRAGRLRHSALTRPASGRISKFETKQRLVEIP